MKKKSSIDVLSHHLVPEMKILTESEKNQLYKKYGINGNGMPRMYSSDPEAEALGAKAGDVIKVYRSDTTGKYFSYRVVVEG